MNNEKHLVLGTWKSLEEQLSSVRWLWPNMIVQNMLTMIVSYAGVGKSMLALQIASLFLNGGLWPDGKECFAHDTNVLWIEGESGQPINVPRALNMGLDLGRFETPLTDPFVDLNLSLPDHRRAIEDAMMDDAIGLGIVDSLSGVHSGDENSSEIRKDLKFLADLSKNADKPLIVLHHLKKLQSGSIVGEITQHDVRGSSAIIQFVRSMIALEKPSSQSDDLRLKTLKNNLAPISDLIGLRIMQNGAGFEYVDAPVPTKLIASKIDQAVEFLRRTLAADPIHSLELIKMARTEGISKSTLDRAKELIGVESVKEPEGWFWHFSQPSGPDMQASIYAIDDLDKTAV
ncbi:AAA family ATPase [bacterium]|nr:AAA family ATPase [bacterium]